MASARAAQPQSWNRYTYVLNNPLRLVDPTGLSDDDATFTITNPCEYGTAGCNPVDLGTVTFVIPPVQPVLLEANNTSIADDLMLGTGQVLSDTVIGAGKFLYNTVYGAANTVNAPIDYGLSFFTDFQFGQAELYRPSTPGEQSAMFGMLIVTAGAGAGSAGTTVARTATASGSTALVPMADAAFTTGIVRSVAGYEVGGNAGMVGQTYNVNIWGLYSTPTSQGLGALTNALRSEASAAGATQLNITGNAVINPQLANPAITGRVARMNGFTFRQVNPNTFFMSSQIP